MISIALCGNPNVGKTELFNQLTGLNQDVGNFPGVTVSRKEGFFFWNQRRVRVVDLPGIYGLDANSLDEKVARDYILEEYPEVIVNVVNATNLERNLYLTLQLLEMGKNVIVALNLMDEARAHGIKINVKELEKFLGVRVVPIVAIKGEGIEELKTEIVKAHDSDLWRHKIVCTYGYEIEEKIKFLIDEIKAEKLNQYYNPRWLAISILSGDKDIQEKISKFLGDRKDVFFQKIKTYFENSEEIKTKLASIRYKYIDHILKQTVRLPQKESFNYTEFLDHIFVHDLLGWFIFIFIMWVGFDFTFRFGEPWVTLLEKFFSFLSDGVDRFLSPGMLSSFLKDGIIGGVGSVITFFPNIFFLFFFLGILEDSGYLSRAAFVADRLMSKLGLSGKSVVPFIFAFGCNVPAIMATRTIPSLKERLVGIMVNPFISCSARLAVYVFLSRLFFPQNPSLALFFIYFFNIIVVILILLLAKKIYLKDSGSYFFLEMPPYRFPRAKSVVLYAWFKGKHFIEKASTIILISSIIIWTLTYFPQSVSVEDKYMFRLAKFVSPIFAPMGIGWEGTAAIINGFAAKEVVISTFTMIAKELGYKSVDPFLNNIFTYPSLIAFLIFFILYVPCIATIGVIKQEAGGWKYVFWQIAMSLGTAYVLAVVGYNFSKLVLR